MKYRLGVFDGNKELQVRLGSLSDVVWDGVDLGDAEAQHQAQLHIKGISKHTRSQIPNGATIHVVPVEEKVTMSLEEFKNLVTKIVKNRLKQYKWFRGVCLDGIQEFYYKNDVSGAVEHAFLTTEFYDNWD